MISLPSDLIPFCTCRYPHRGDGQRGLRSFVFVELTRFPDIIQMLPTSHHLAFAVQYITLSGVLLLRCVAYGSQANLVEAVIVDAEKCVKLLEGMEGIWNGAKRCKEIVSDLLVVVKTRHYCGLSALDTLQTSRGESRYFIMHYQLCCHLMPYSPVEGPLLAPLRPKVLRGSANFLTSSRLRTHVPVHDLMVHNLSITHGLLNQIPTGGRAGVLSLSGIVFKIKAKMNRRHRTLFPYNDCPTLGHRSTMTFTSNSNSTSIDSMRNACLGNCQVLASARSYRLFSRTSLLCLPNIRNTKKRQGYRWISMPFLPAGRLMGCPSQGMISWATTFTRS